MQRRRIIFHGETQILDANARALALGQFVDLPDGMVHYELAGPTGARCVVLIHGFSVPYFIWDPTFDALVQAGFRVLRYDLYGRGFSDRPDTAYDQDLFDRQLQNLLAALGVKGPVDLVGLSMGGAIAAVFSQRRPGNVRKLCLIDPAGLPWAQPIPARLLATPVLGEWIMGLLGEKVLVNQFRAHFQRHRKYDEFARKFHAQMWYSGFKRALLSTFRSGVTTGAHEAFREIGRQRIPVLLMWGREDRLVPFELNERVRELIPDLEFHAVESAAHTPHLEHPELVNPRLIEFLA